ncbi:MAG: hypothetical protein HYU34_00455 [Candidatus Omnitrophica bacterium]|nr:hypothetical protein [Candidatus Omnitrophota bacterium]
MKSAGGLLAVVTTGRLQPQDPVPSQNPNTGHSGKGTLEINRLRKRVRLLTGSGPLDLSRFPLKIPTNFRQRPHCGSTVFLENGE